MTQAVTKKKKTSQKSALARRRRLETAGPSAERLRQLVKENPIPQHWYQDSEDWDEKARG